MERREFFGTGLAVGGTALLTGGCAPRTATTVSGGVAPQAGPVRLASNENPLGLSPAGRRAILEGLGESNRYPRQKRTDLIEALARKHAVPTPQVQLGAGSTEILQMAVQGTPADAVIVFAEPTYEDVARYASASGRRVAAVPLRADMAHDIGRMREAAGNGPALVFICNPNNPTGTITPCNEVDAWIQSAGERTTFIVDEAYFEFVDDPAYRSAISWIATRPNVVVVRTFSKVYGMAGLRLGYALGQPAIIQRLRLFACQNNANELALAAGLASLGDTTFAERSVAANRAGRAKLTAALDELGLAWLPSHTNFVMHRISGDVAAYNQRMLEAGFRVGRPFPPMLNYSRVSIGLSQDMDRFVDTLRAFRRQSWL